MSSVCSISGSISGWRRGWRWRWWCFISWGWVRWWVCREPCWWRMKRWVWWRIKWRVWKGLWFWIKWWVCWHRFGDGHRLPGCAGSGGYWLCWHRFGDGRHPPWRNRCRLRTRLTTRLISRSTQLFKLDRALHTAHQLVHTAHQLVISWSTEELLPQLTHRIIKLDSVPPHQTLKIRILHEMYLRNQREHWNAKA